MSTKRDVLLELAVFCLALIAASDLAAIDSNLGTIGVLALFCTFAIAGGTATLVAYEILTIDPR